MDHSTIISLNFRNMFTIVFMVIVGWFLLHLIGNMAQNMGIGGNYSTSADVSASGGVTL